MFSSLEGLVEKLSQRDQAFPKVLLENLRSARRFPLGYKINAPFNCLTFLDPR